MNKKICFILFLMLALMGMKDLYSQEFNFDVTVSSAQVSGTDQRAFESLKEGITNFMNNRVWTNLKLEPEERIEGAIVVNVKKKEGNILEAELNIALRRPTFKTNYTTPLFNYIDTDFVFEYIESQPLDFTENSYMSNLTSTLAFYAYYCLGLYFDSFGLYGGDPFFKVADQIVTSAQSAEESGWKAFDDKRNRYWLNENMMNASYKPLRQYIYEYHRLGLDKMSTKQDEGKTAITKSLEYIKQVYSERPSLLFIQVLNDTKRNEWKSIYTEGSQQDKTKAVNIFREIDPSHATEYEEILSGRK
ncbi:MAG: DUF4835 family protein [Lentimicrobiaceae bacterium]|nr:DUF4835 family protein [Lentimicrobiaceae bacterium]